MELNLFKSTKNYQSEKSFDENFLFNNEASKLTTDQLKQIKGGGGDDDETKIKW